MAKAREERAAKVDAELKALSREEDRVEEEEVVEERVVKKAKARKPARR